MSSHLLAALTQVTANPLQSALKASLESDTVNKEREFEIYGKVRDMSALLIHTNFEKQDQWGIFVPKTPANGGEGNIRVRKTDDGSTIKYELTGKVKHETYSDEVNEESGEAMLNIFKRLADQGLVKTRFIFPIEGTELKYEIDVFYNAAGTASPWVKIDLECGEDIQIDNLPSFPVELDEVRVFAPGKKSDEDKAWLNDLFSREFRTTNLFVDGHIPSNESFILAGGDYSDAETRSIKDRVCKLYEMADSLSMCISYNDQTAKFKQELQEFKSQCDRFLAENQDEQ